MSVDGLETRLKSRSGRFEDFSLKQVQPDKPPTLEAWRGGWKAAMDYREGADLVKDAEKLSKALKLSSQQDIARIHRGISVVLYDLVLTIEFPCENPGAILFDVMKRKGTSSPDEAASGGSRRVRVTAGGAPLDRATVGTRHDRPRAWTAL